MQPQLGGGALDVAGEVEVGLERVAELLVPPRAARGRPAGRSLERGRRERAQQPLGAQVVPAGDVAPSAASSAASAWRWDRGASRRSSTASPSPTYRRRAERLGELSPPRACAATMSPRRRRRARAWPGRGRGSGRALRRRPRRADAHDQRALREIAVGFERRRPPRRPPASSAAISSCSRRRRSRCVSASDCRIARGVGAARGRARSSSSASGAVLDQPQVAEPAVAAHDRDAEPRLHPVAGVGRDADGLGRAADAVAEQHVRAHSGAARPRMLAVRSESSSPNCVL